MKKMQNLLVSLMLVFGIVSVSQATLIDFESFSLNAVVSGPGVFPDVTFSAGNEDIAVNTNASLLGPDFGGNNCVRAVPLFSNPDPFRADFSVPVNSVSVVIGDNDADFDNLFLMAYDASNNLIAIDTRFIPDSFVGGVTLAVSASNIDHVIFGTLATDPAPNSVYWDNFNYTIAPEPVAIDIKPGSDRNSINSKSKGKIRVAIFSTEEFDAPSQVDQDSLTFGATGDEDSLAFCNRPKDIDGDGLKDLVCHFYTELSEFQCRDTEGTLRGVTKGGTPIEGKDSVRIRPCK
jgi:hypothetical protein